jgi:hypothetical protein
MSVTKKQIHQINNRIHNLVVAVGELSLQVEREFGEDSKQAYTLCDILRPLAEAYEASV